MNKTLAMMAMLAGTLPDSPYGTFPYEKELTTKKVWNTKLKCYTIDGEPVDKNGNYIEIKEEIE